MRSRVCIGSYVVIVVLGDMHAGRKVEELKNCMVKVIRTSGRLGSVVLWKLLSKANVLCMLTYGKQ